MSIPDIAMDKYYRLVTRFSPADIDLLLENIASGEMHPRDAKMKLAREIVSIFYGEESAQPAEDAFIALFQKKAIPDDMPEYSLEEGQSLMDVLLATGLVDSKSNARRMVDQKAVRLDGETLDRAGDAFPHIGVLQVGKRKFVRVK